MKNQVTTFSLTYAGQMKLKKLFTTALSLVLFATGSAQIPNKAKLDQFLDRLTEKNKAMGSLTIAQDSVIVYTRAIGYSQFSSTEKKSLTAVKEN